MKTDYRDVINPDAPERFRGNPFAKQAIGGWVASVVVECRKSDIQRFSRIECEAALAMPDLQRTLIPVIRRRLREIYEMERRGVA
ncbi:MAG: hypothetical protein SFU56_19440 [Capsulimonadales bacterium]|nr:hypothetical protein [Capsulimonadales bacterium]